MITYTQKTLNTYIEIHRKYTPFCIPIHMDTHTIKNTHTVQSERDSVKEYSYTYINIYVYMNICTRTRTRRHMHNIHTKNIAYIYMKYIGNTPFCIPIHMDTHTHKNTHTVQSERDSVKEYSYTYINMYVYMSVRVHIHIYTCMYVYV